MSSHRPWRTLNNLLKQLVDDLSRREDDVDDEAEFYEDQEPMHPHADQPHFWEFAHRIFEFIHCQCHSDVEREVRLKICTVMDIVPKQYLAPSLSILVTNKVQDSVMHELLIMNRLNSTNKVKLSVPNETDTLHFADDSDPICVHTAIIPHANCTPLGSLLELRDGILYRAQGRAYLRDLSEIQSRGNERSLKHLLSISTTQWDEQPKYALALMPAHNLYHLFGGNWIKNGWGRDNIIFFTNGGQIPLRPYFGVSLAQDRSNESGTAATRAGRYSAILEMGVILLELHLGQRLERFLKEDHGIPVDKDLLTNAFQTYHLLRPRILSLRYRHAIEACLKAKAMLSEDCSLQDVRTMLAEHVVKPLQQEGRMNLEEWIPLAKLDEAAASYNIDPESRQPPSSYSRQKVRGVRPRRSNPKMHSDTGNGSRGPGNPNNEYGPAHQDPQAGTQLLEDQDRADPSTKSARKLADKWKGRFKKLLETQRNSPGFGVRRLKVALIDTGIDRGHFDFMDDLDEDNDSRRIKEVKDWTRNANPTDVSGHGAHIAGLLLELTSNVDLFIHRVSTTEKLENPYCVVKVCMNYSRCNKRRH
ncbi:uncharacterized protein PG986_006452 [Apiospora aurea]|uniref:Peptidase S8/S53 domain-containing protein n=1 Tax=Apiospora aurea TaxID=335848 RepID=A0ABR1QKG7_9PEZI